MRYLVAVSGGVDSVVLLDQLVSSGTHELIVAHFDHGIRPDSADDARFVEGLARQYSLPFASLREELGENASEEQARHRRYGFLRSVANAHHATIVTAHHADDIIETIAINSKRGTGWRGLAVLDNPVIVRPLLHLSKKEIIDYALQHRLEWVEDSTNATDVYLRNRLRHLFAQQLSTKRKAQLLRLREGQCNLKQQIDRELSLFFQAGEYARYQFIAVDAVSAAEILRAVIVSRTGTSPTRPQLERSIIAIKTARPGTTHEIGGGVRLAFSVRCFIVETP